MKLSFFAAVFFAALVVAIPQNCSAESDVLSSLGMQEQKPSKQDEKAREALRKMILEKKGELNGTSWTVQIDSQSKKGALLGEDTLVFQNDKFRSEKAGKIDFSSTNYTLTVQEEGPTIWETMQTSKDGEVCFWRGEWKEDVMTGIVSRQLKEGSEEYYFTSAGKKEIPKTSEEKEEETQINPAQETAPAAGSDVLGGAPVPVEKSVPAQTAKKKTSWF